MQNEFLTITEIQFKLQDIAERLKAISKPSSNKPVSHEYLGLVIEEIKLKRTLAEFYIQ
jgi:hypothetical protein